MRAVWETNVFGVLAVYQAMLPLLRLSSDARIVNVSSGVGSLATNADPAFGYRRMFGPVYPASKAALNAISLAMMIELEGTGIKVNLVSPGLHRHQPQQLRRHRIHRGRLARSRPRRLARPGRPVRHLHRLGKPDHPVVSGTSAARTCEEPLGRGDRPIDRRGVDIEMRHPALPLTPLRR